MKVKIFERSWGASGLEVKINKWIEENKNITIKNIKYAMHDGYHSALFMYETETEVKL